MQNHFIVADIDLFTLSLFILEEEREKKKKKGMNHAEHCQNP